MGFRKKSMSRRFSYGRRILYSLRVNLPEREDLISFLSFLFGVRLWHASRAHPERVFIILLAMMMMMMWSKGRKILIRFTNDLFSLSTMVIKEGGKKSGRAKWPTLKSARVRMWVSLCRHASSFGRPILIRLVCACQSKSKCPDQMSSWKNNSIFANLHPRTSFFDLTDPSIHPPALICVKILFLLCINLSK